MKDLNDLSKEEVYDFAVNVQEKFLKSAKKNEIKIPKVQQHLVLEGIMNTIFLMQEHAEDTTEDFNVKFANINMSDFFDD